MARYEDAAKQKAYEDHMKYYTSTAKGDQTKEGERMWNTRFEAEYDARAGSSGKDSSSANTNTAPTAPSAEDVAKTQMAQSQAAPDSQAEAEVAGKEKASRRRKAAAGGKRRLSVARSTGSGLNI